MSNVSVETIEKMNAYIEARNSPERRQIVEMVSQYVLSDLPPEEDKEEALVLSRYHLSTDKGTEDLKALYVDAISWLEEMQ
jgi:hypothetical protein